MAQLNKAQFLFLHEDIKQVALRLASTYFQNGTLDEVKQPAFQFYGYGANWRANFPSITGVLLKHREAQLMEGVQNDIPSTIADEAFNGKYLYDRFTYTRSQETIIVGENYLQLFLWFVQPQDATNVETWEQYCTRNELLDITQSINHAPSFSTISDEVFLEEDNNDNNIPLLYPNLNNNNNSSNIVSSSLNWKVLALGFMGLVIALLSLLVWKQFFPLSEDYETPISYNHNVGQDTSQVIWYLSNPWDGEMSYMSEMLSELIAEIEANTDGKFKILVFNNSQLPNSKGRSLKDPQESLLALQKNQIQMLHSSASYWKNRVPAGIFFCSIPNGMNYEKTLNWLTKGKGQELCNRLYAPLNIVPYPCGYTGEQYPGSFRDSLKSIDDFKGMRIRIGGLGAEVLKTFGAVPKTMPQRDILRYIATDSLDAAEWLAPYDDYRMGFFALRKFRYYYRGGWHEPNTTNQMFINSHALKTLENKMYKGKSYKTILEEAISKYSDRMLGVFNDRNSAYEARIKKEYPEVKILDLPENIIQPLRARSDEIVKKYYQDNKNEYMMQEIYESYKKNQ